MSKNPYEVRLDLLAMAQAILNDQNMNDRIKVENEWGLEREKASTRIANGESNVTIPPYPETKSVTAEDIIKLAEQMNTFVSRSETF